MRAPEIICIRSIQVVLAPGSCDLFSKHEQLLVTELVSVFWNVALKYEVLSKSPDLGWGGRTVDRKVIHAGLEIQTTVWHLKMLETDEDAVNSSCRLCKSGMSLRDGFLECDT